MLILLAALATRLVTFGNPVVIADDQFYLLAGDALLGGELPYIDVWDRKPFGLFALFAGIAALGGGSILVMQLIATLFAAATAAVIYRISLRFAEQLGALFAALAYLFMLPLLGGQSGQSPVFYNLFVALAGLALLSSVDRDRRTTAWRALGAMLACGVAMAIKPVALVEGGFVGLSFLWLLRRQGAAPGALVRQALAMIGIALLPTLLPLTGYALAGREALDAYLYANYGSILDKPSLGSAARLAGIGYFLLYAMPLLLLAAVGALLRRKAIGAERSRSLLLLGWITAAVGGYLLVPHFFDHYALPLLVPLSVSAATLFVQSSGKLYFAGLVAFCLISGPMLDWNGNRRVAAQFAEFSDRVDQARHGGCLYVADGPSWLYASTGACRPTRYLFPHHLMLATEADAVGVDPAAELDRIFASRPAVVVTQDSERRNHLPAIDRQLSSALKRDYRTVATVPSTADYRLATLRLWQRNDLPPPPR